MALRKIDLMHNLFGKVEQLKCRDCSNLITGRYHDKTLRKCKVYGLTHSEASDWALKYSACGLFNKEYNGPEIIKRLRSHSRRQHEDVSPLEGQMEMEV